MSLKLMVFNMHQIPIQFTVILMDLMDPIH